MSLEETLDKLGLTKYEAQAYRYILQNGPTEAGEITKETSIPNGKIYETLNKLENYGFIEIQQTRPKRYHFRNINIAMEEYLDRKKENLDNEFKKLEFLGSQAIKEFEQLHMNQLPKKEEIFWRTAFGSEIHDLYYNTIKEATKSILYFLPHSIHDRSIGGDSLSKHKHESYINQQLEKDFVDKLLLQGKEKSIKILFVGQQECHIFKNLFEKAIEEETGIEVRALKQDIITAPMLLIDETITIFDIVDPLDNHSTIGITKIWDRRLNKNLNEKIQKLWNRSIQYKKVFPIQSA